MKTSRRSFLSASTALAASIALPSTLFGKHTSSIPAIKERFDPWIELIPDHIHFNAKVLHQLSGGRPVLAVIKNNGYGLGDVQVAKILDDLPMIAGFAAVKTEVCLKVKAAGIKKPILHMGMATDQDFYELAANDIQLAIYDQQAPKLLASISAKLGKTIKAHVYLDTGMSRMGIPYHKALPWIQELSKSKQIAIQGSFMGFTEDPEFDKEQLNRFTELQQQASSRKVNMGKLHAASSNAIFHFPASHLDMVRPGIALYGAYPTYPEREKEIAELKVGYKLQTRVVRVEQLRAGDSVSYGRNYVASKPTWIATLPIGHADGYLRKAVKKAKILVNGKLYSVIGAVSASHTIIEIGEQQEVHVGDLATLVGPDHPEIHPSHLSTVTGVSVYDVLMHMSARLPKVISE